MQVSRSFVRCFLQLGVWVGCCGVAATAAEPLSLSLSISDSSKTSGELQVSGQKGVLYGVSSSEDLRNWTRLDTQAAAEDGHARFVVSLADSQRFFRAFSMDSGVLEGSPAAVALGKRLFLEPRFAQFFYAHSTNDVNSFLRDGGDPVLNDTLTLTVPVPGPFKGQSMNCGACHLSDELQRSGLGNRSFADFAIRSPIPQREDGRKFTFRNAPSLVNASVKRSGEFFLHFDGEFPDGKSLIQGTLLGRNFGWLATERDQALAHIARIIREDNGQYPIASQIGGSYRALFLGTDASLDPDLRLPESWRMDVSFASDAEVLEKVAELVNAYLESLTFKTDEKSGAFQASPYDVFLERNALPKKPLPGESDLEYSRRLRGLIAKLAEPVFVTPADGAFKTHDQVFGFGSAELAGLKMFLAEPDPSAASVPTATGNCVVCHPAPHFTDFNFHNTGATQWEYDSIHGEGAFAQISIPSLAQRRLTPEQFLPVTPFHPKALNRFLEVPSLESPGGVDLGLWNVYANPDFEPSQEPLQSLLNTRFGNMTPDLLLPKTVALFKTPGLRDLDHSAPFLHTGQASTLESVIFFYRFTSDLARDGEVRNGDPEMAKIFLSKSDRSPLVAFLRSLNEDYP